MTLLIRPALPADVPAVLPMVRAICDQHRVLDPDKFGFLDDIVERYAQWLPLRATDPRSVFLVAVDATDSPNAPFGYLVGTVNEAVPIYTIREFGWIHDIWVDPAHRGQRVGQALVNTAAREFAMMGVKQLRLETAYLNDTARALFASCGFRTCAIEMLKAVTSPTSPAIA